MVSQKPMTGKFGVGKSSGNNNQSTPEEVTEALLHQVKFKGNIWECACGKGRMSKVLEAHGYSVISSDKYHRGYGLPGVDFLRPPTVYDNIVTNPPFDLAEELIHVGIRHIRHKMALFLRLAFLESVHRRDEIFTKYPLARVIVFSERVGLMPALPNKKPVKAVAYAWYVWDKSHKGSPTISWTKLQMTG